MHINILIPSLRFVVKDIQSHIPEISLIWSYNKVKIGTMVVSLFISNLISLFFNIFE